MIIGYGMQDPDNWDTGPYGRPIDPYQDEWDAIDKSRAERKRPHGDPIKPNRCVAPRAQCIQRHDGNHNFVVAYSGSWRCTRCGFHYERHGVPGRGFPPDGQWPCYYVDKIHSLGTGLPPETTQRKALGYRS